MYNEFEIRTMHLTLPRQRALVERFLAANDLRLDDTDYYAGVFAVGSDEMLAGGGLSANIIKCVAVDPSYRDENLSGRLVSHLISVATERGYRNIKVYTKPENKSVFESMSFTLLAEAPKAVLMETGTTTIKDYLAYLKRESDKLPKLDNDRPDGAIVMNANPFTVGHRYLVRQAARQVERLFVIAVKEDVSMFSYGERLEMIRRGCAGFPNVMVLEGSDYAISAATFPTYFLKSLTDASETQMRLDLDLFRRYIAPTLGTSIRFVGSEDSDKLTLAYNRLMKECLSNVREITRLKLSGRSVSATNERNAIENGHLSQARPWIPTSTLPYLIAHLASHALRVELDTTPKPGLVDRHDNGSHSDMDYELMRKAIAALEPHFAKIALCDNAAAIQQAGIEAERDMLTATGGVNTHRGALFALGLTAAAAMRDLFNLQKSICTLAAGIAVASGTHGAAVTQRYNVKGALATALEGYPMLFDLWLPYYQRLRNDPFRNHKTLLLIMTTLDDTNVYHRGDAETAAWVKHEAREALYHFCLDTIEQMNRRFIERNISPGGSADMLSLTIFIDTLLT